MAFNSGTGTLLDPYIITTPEEWNFANTDNAYASKHFALGADINDTEKIMQTWFWSVSTISDTRFSGSLDGRGHTISNAAFVPRKIGSLYSSASLIFWGLGNIPTLKNLKVEDCTFNATNNDAISRIAALAYEYGNLYDVHVRGCTFNAITNGASLVSSIRGDMDNCSAIDCDVNGSVVYTFGWGSAQSRISNVRSTGCILTGSSTANGLVGNRNAIYSAPITNCYAANLVNAPTKHGFSTVNYDSGGTSSCFWDTQVSGSSNTTLGATGLTTAQMKATSGSILGLATGAGTGKWTFVEGQYPAFKVEGEVIPVTSVSLNKSSTTLTANTTEQLIATVAPADATDKTVTWSSSNPTVATVSATGLVTAVAAGTATITVTTADGAKTATCAVTVQATTYTLTYDANGGTGTPPATQSGATSYTVGSASGLSKTDALFRHWNTAADGSGTTYIAGSTITPSANTTLYAIWTQNITIGGSYTAAAFSALINDASVYMATTTSDVTMSDNGIVVINNPLLKLKGTHEISAYGFNVAAISSIENVTITSTAPKLTSEYNSFRFTQSIATPITFAGVTFNAALKTHPAIAVSGGYPERVVVLPDLTMTNCTVNGIFNVALDNAVITGSTFNYVPYLGHNQAVAIDGSYNLIEDCTFNGTYNGQSSPIAFKFFPQWRQVSCVGNIVRNCTVPNNGHEESLGSECRFLTGSGAVTAKTATTITAALTQLPANEKSTLRVGQHLAIGTGAGRGNYYSITAISGATYTLDTSRFTIDDVAIGDVVTIAPMFCDNLFEDIDVVLDNGFLDMGQGCNVGLSLWQNCHGNTVRRLHCTTTKSEEPNYWGMIGQDGGWVAPDRIQLNSYNVWDSCTGYDLAASVLMHTQHVDARNEQLVEPQQAGNPLGIFYNSHSTVTNCMGSAYCEVVNYKDVLWEMNQPAIPETIYTGILNMGDLKNMSPQVLGTVDWAAYYIDYYRDHYTEGDNPYWNPTYNATIPEYVSKGWTGAKQPSYTAEPNWLWSYELPIGQESQSTITVIEPKDLTAHSHHTFNNTALIERPAQAKALTAHNTIRITTNATLARLGALIDLVAKNTLSVLARADLRRVQRINILNAQSTLSVHSSALIERIKKAITEHNLVAQSATTTVTSALLGKVTELVAQSAVRTHVFADIALRVLAWRTVRSQRVVWGAGKEVETIWSSPKRIEVKDCAEIQTNNPE